MPGVRPISMGAARTGAVLLTLGAMATPALAQTTPTGPTLAARIAAAKEIVDENAEPQGLMLRCLTLKDARIAALAVSDWTAQLVKADAVLATVGVPPSERDALLLPVRVQTLTRGGETPDALKASCDADRDWEKRWALMEAQSFAPDLSLVLTGKRN